MVAQVLNNRMFDNGANKPPLKAEQREVGEAGERDFKFQLPEDEEGQVRRDIFFLVHHLTPALLGVPVPPLLFHRKYQEDFQRARQHPLHLPVRQVRL